MLPWILTLDLSWLAWCFVGFLGNPQHLSYFYLLEPCSEEQHQRRDYSHQWHVVYMWQFICKRLDNMMKLFKIKILQELSINISSVTYLGVCIPDATAELAADCILDPILEVTLDELFDCDAASKLSTWSWTASAALVGTINWLQRIIEIFQLKLLENVNMYGYMYDI